VDRESKQQHPLHMDRLPHERGVRSLESRPGKSGSQRGGECCD
jgi:hypothetical protein